MILQYPKAICSLIINNENLVLAVSRKDDHSIFGLPGGKVDQEDDSLEKAAMRELAEETGVQANGGIPVFTSICYGLDEKHYLTTTFMWDKLWSLPKQIEGEGIVAWVSPDVICENSFGKYRNFAIFNRNLLKSLNIHGIKSEKIIRIVE